MRTYTDKAQLLSADLGSDDVDVVANDIVFDGFFKMRRYELKHKQFDGGWTEEFQRELFCRGDAVAGVLYDPRLDAIGLIEQFRPGAHAMPTGPWCLEVVAGMIDKAGEEPEQVMARELQEEAGLMAERLEFITRYLSSPGGTDELIHLFAIICDLSEAGGIHGLDSEHEDIRLQVFKSEEVFDSLYQGRANNAATLIGLQWLQLNRPRLQREFIK